MCVRLCVCECVCWGLGVNVKAIINTHTSSVDQTEWRSTKVSHINFQLENSVVVPFLDCLVLNKAV